MEETDTKLNNPGEYYLIRVISPEYEKIWPVWFKDTEYDDDVLVKDGSDNDRNVRIISKRESPIIKWKPHIKATNIGNMTQIIILKTSLSILNDLTDRGVSFWEKSVA